MPKWVKTEDWQDRARNKVKTVNIRKSVCAFWFTGFYYVKTSREEFIRGVVITYVDDLLLTGWQHHMDAITQALLVKYVVKRAGSLAYCVHGETAARHSEGIDF